MKRWNLFAAIGLFSITKATLFSTLASVKSLGMGLAVMACPLDTMALVFNPAAIVDVGCRADFGALGVFTRAKSILSDNRAPIPGINSTYSNHQRWLFTPEFGATYKFKDWLSVGIAAFNQKELHVKYKRPILLLGQSKLGIDYFQQVLSPTVAANVGWGQSFGISLIWAIQRLGITGLENIAHPSIPGVTFSIYPDNVTNKGYEYSQGVGVKFGWKGDFGKWMSMGASYQPQITMSKFKRYKGFLANAGKLNVPDLFRAGVAFFPFDCLAVTCDYELICYNQISSLHNPVMPNLLISDLGESSGAGFGWENQSIWRFGINWNISCDLAVRAGYRFANTNFSSENISTNLLTQDLTVDILTVGASYWITKSMELSFFAGYGFRGSLKGPVPLVPFFGGNIEMDQQRTAAGVAIGWCY